MKIMKVDSEHEREMEALDAVTPRTHRARDARHFRRIVAARESRDAAEVELTSAVAAARAAGDSWTVIGVALGTTRQGAQRRFGHRVT